MVTSKVGEEGLDLCEYEIRVLRLCAGKHDSGLVWGGAMAAALEFLCGKGLAENVRGTYRATVRGVRLVAEKEDGCGP